MQGARLLRRRGHRTWPTARTCWWSRTGRSRLPAGRVTRGCRRPPCGLSASVPHAPRACSPATRSTGRPAPGGGSRLSPRPPGRWTAGSTSCLSESRGAGQPVGMHKLFVNQAITSQGLYATQTLSTFFDGIACHTEEGFALQRRAAEAGFKEAVRERDEPFGDFGLAASEGPASRAPMPFAPGDGCASPPTPGTRSTRPTTPSSRRAATPSTSPATSSRPAQGGATEQFVADVERIAGEASIDLVAARSSRRPSTSPPSTSGSTARRGSSRRRSPPSRASTTRRPSSPWSRAPSLPTPETIA